MATSSWTEVEDIALVEAWEEVYTDLPRRGQGVDGSVCNNILHNSVVRTTAAPLTPYLQGFGLYARTVRSSRVATNLWRIHPRILARRTSRRLPSSTTATK
ncbi:hypothetical protein HanIR_Chr14g0682431 [Helianthus annuus]|nr:hypothetical protein HanIR_Chr14g0682431 [Helianthus annuus]